ncbi:50S ribosomal protein L21e [Candidatus Woesearchaeota archaeon]|jgi:large subunit ribosomal protein L21e|nr:50S ribosomal protein L21e [Candidatus Woesearchaeota archaeon]MBT6519342.1 50S ribosomal protein L21e [Candidatus Woesearchaeota archaeon]MBT7366802.1 50S ribosomal protein L21e [Candidatus Woesearchaeota archaeon]
MVSRVGGARRKTRNKFKKPIRRKGKISISKFFQKMEEGDKVQLLAETAYQKGMYFRRFHGKTGVVKCTRGKCYEIMIKDINKEKTLVVHPVHLKKIA